MSSTCENCNGEISDENLHTMAECFTRLNERIEELEDENRGLREAIEAYKRQLQKKKITATVPPPSVV